MSSKRKFCINCGKDIPAEAAYCPFCSAMQLDVLPKQVPQNKTGGNKENNKPNKQTKKTKGTPSRKYWLTRMRRRLALPI